VLYLYIMSDFLYILREPWPWYVAGPLIGLTVPGLFLLGNKWFGISSSLRHVCAACLPGKIPFFTYDWRKEIWNLYFVAGIVAGGVVSATLLSSGTDVVVNENLKASLARYNVNDYSALVTLDLFSFSELTTLRGFIIMVIGGFLVGFGTRYAGGCTSGHSITGISTLQLASVIATTCFMAGGILMTNIILPYILAL
jgi:uncharacterized membrane protein YedE/YeeE